MIFEIVVMIFLIISLCLNVFLLRRLLYFSENVDEILFSLGEFSGHLEEVNGYELYYGDEVLAKLLEHSKEAVEDIKQFQDNYGGTLDGKSSS